MFEPLVSPGGLVVVNSSIVDRKVERSDVQAIYIPATEIARDAGLQSAANVVLATTYLSLSGVIPLQTLKTCIPLVLRKREYLEKNLKIVEKTLDYLENTN
jgi:2-oxoglutarate ferredoxin oxidoreductase subunit gamma